MVESRGSLKFPLRHLIVITASLPFTAFFVCIYLSLQYNYEEATWTHCSVENYLPSISSAIGEFIPQRYIWRTAIAVHATPRFLTASLYFNFLKNNLPTNIVFRRFIKVNAFFNITENFALLGLSFVSSGENYGIHKLFFSVFGGCSILYISLSVLLFKEVSKGLSTPLEKFSYFIKKHLMIVNLACFCLAFYFFYRHNSYCEPGGKVYTIPLL